MNPPPFVDRSPPSTHSPHPIPSSSFPTRSPQSTSSYPILTYPSELGLGHSAACPPAPPRPDRLLRAGQCRRTRRHPPPALACAGPGCAVKHILHPGWPIPNPLPLSDHPVSFAIVNYAKTARRSPISAISFFSQFFSGSNLQDRQAVEGHHCTEIAGTFNQSAPVIGHYNELWRENKRNDGWQPWVVGSKATPRYGLLRPRLRT